MAEIAGGGEEGERGGGGKGGEVEPQGTSELRTLPHWQGESPSLAECTQGH